MGKKSCCNKKVLEKDLVLCKNLEVKGDVFIKGILDAERTATFKQDLIINGNVTLLQT